MGFRDLFNMPETHKNEKRGKEEQKEVGQSPFKSKEVTLRVQQVPIDATVESLRASLKAIAQKLSPDSQNTLKEAQIRSICRRDQSFCTATIIITITKPLDELLQALGRATTAAGLEYEFDSSFWGITPLWEDVSGADCDIIAVPGLGSHAIGSWKAPKNNNIWLRDWLPKDVPKIRVALYGYHTDLQQDPSYDSIEDLGGRLLENLASLRRETNTQLRPVIFIGHSLGGLLIKDALVRSLKSPIHRTHHRMLHVSCCGLMFFGVPHDGIRMEELKDIVKGQPNDALIRSIVWNTESEPTGYLKKLTTEFAECFDARWRTKVVSFYEKLSTKTTVKKADGTLERSGPARLLVTEASATKIGLSGTLHQDSIASQADHSTLTKFTSRSDDRYRIARDRITDLIAPAPLQQAQERGRFLLEAVQSEAASYNKDQRAGAQGGGGNISFQGNFDGGNNNTVNFGHGNVVTNNSRH